MQIRRFRFLLFWIFIPALVSCEGDLEKIEQFKEQETPTEEARNINIEHFEDGRIKTRITAPLTVRHLAKEPFMEFPEGFEFFVYNDSSEIQTRLIAQYGRIEEKQEKLYARDSVVVHSKDGKSLESEELIYNPQGPDTTRITSTKFVKIITADQIIFGDSLRAKEDFQWYRILNIKGSIWVTQEQNTTANP